MNGKTNSKIKFLFISEEALAVDVAWQVVKEGHDVRYYIHDKTQADNADGFVPKTDDWKKDVDWADIVVMDDTLGQGTIAKKLREQGKKVVGGTPYTDRLEDDRVFGQEELKNAGVSIIPYWGFMDFDEAINFVRANPDKYVIKPSGEAANIKHLLFVGQEDDGSDVVRILESYKRVWSNTIKAFQLQKRMMGVEVGIGAFFNGKRFIYPVNVNFEHKKLFPGEIGPPTGEMGTSMFWSSPNRLFNATLKKMEGKLAEEGYVGYIDLNCIVNASGIYPLEFTARFGYPTIHIQQEGILTPIGEFLYNLANGVDADFRARRGFQIGVYIVVPPFPYRDKRVFDSYSKNAVVVFKKKEQIEGVHIAEVKLANDEWVVTGPVGIAVLVVGMGQTMKQAQQQAYSRIQNILVPNMYYRVDIGDRWFEDSDRLHSWGYLREL